MQTVDSQLDEITRIWRAIPEHKLDATAAIAMVVNAFESYDPETHARWAPHKWFRVVCPREFAKIRNARAAVQAFTLLKAERYPS